METWSLEPEYHERRNISDRFFMHLALKKCHSQHFQQLWNVFVPFELFLS